MTELEHVWQPGAIGALQLPHRIVMGAMHLGLERLDDGGHALAAFYRARAAGGAGLIVTGGSAVSRVGAGGASYSVINDDADAGALAAIPEAVHAEGGLVLLQLFHAGRYALEQAFGLQPVAPSAVYSGYSRCEPRAMSEEEILETIDDFARGAARARELGFDGVEIMGSEGYLLSQFMAPATNRREDEWGGSLEGRIRLPLMVAAAAREALGDRGALVYRLSGADLVPDGASLEDVIALASRLASGPADALNVGIGWHEARVPTVQSGVPHGAWAPWARAVREAAEVPVIASNRVNTAALADALVRDGFADFVSMARPLLADPLFVRKSRERRARGVNICIACNQCIDQSIFDRRVSCSVNPRAGYELHGSADGGGARVAVVGGGPAGMEAARALAVSGYAVTLFEAGSDLGGQFLMARRIPGKEDFGLTGAYFADELSRLGVGVSLGTRADVDAIDGFDAVVVAAGVIPRQVTLEGVELPHVCRMRSCWALRTRCRWWASASRSSVPVASARTLPTCCPSMVGGAVTSTRDTDSSRRSRGRKLGRSLVAERGKMSPKSCFQACDADAAGGADRRRRRSVDPMGGRAGAQAGRRGDADRRRVRAHRARRRGHTGRRLAATDSGGHGRDRRRSGAGVVAGAAPAGTGAAARRDRRGGRGRGARCRPRVPAGPRRSGCCRAVAGGRPG